MILEMYSRKPSGRPKPLQQAGRYHSSDRENDGTRGGGGGGKGYGSASSRLADSWQQRAG